MKTTIYVLVGWIALALISAKHVTAGSFNGASETWLAAAAPGQANPADNPPADPRRQAADLLRRARQAMAEKDFVAADSLISQAETLGVKYSIFYTGDTPDRARRDLERTRNGAAAAKPSGLLSPLGGSRDKVPASDPFAAHSIDPATAANAGQSDPNALAGTAARAPTAMGQAANRPSNSPLRTARLALAVGDLRRAMEFVQRAKATPMSYGPSDDTPDKVEVAIRRQLDLQGLDKGTEAYARGCSRNLTEQADALLRWNEYDEAERLARRAAALRIDYGPFEQKPLELLQKIASARRQERSAAAAVEMPGYANASGGGANLVSRQRAVELIGQARDAIGAGRLDQAEMLARQAQQIVPNTAFAPGEDCPELVLLDLQRLKQRTPSAVVPAGGQYAGQGDANVATAAVYNPASDQTRNMTASGTEPGFPDNQGVQPGSRYAQVSPPNPMRPPEPPRPESPSGGPSQGMVLFQQGEAALRAHDTARAYALFRQATNYPNDLDPDTARRLHDHLQLLTGPGAAGPATAAGQPPTMASQAAAQQQLLLNQIRTELAHRESTARVMRATDPKGALAILQEARKKVEMTAGLDPPIRDQFLRSVDRAIAETNQVIAQNRPQIELNEKNTRVDQDVQRRQRVKVEVQEKIAMKCDEYNRLVEEQRYAEAVQVAKQASELAPREPVVIQMLAEAKLIQNFREAEAIRDAKADGFVRAENNVEWSGVPFDDNRPYQFANDGKNWGDFTKARMKYAGGRPRPKTESEIEIEKKLRTPVSLQFTAAPLGQVMDYLAKLAEVNLYLDPTGLTEEGVTRDTPVTINLPSEIMLKSALHLILEPLHLSYVIKDQVLKVTSEQMRDVQVYTYAYPVGDLVIPIPNFVPGMNTGLAGAYTKAMADVSYFGGALTGPSFNRRAAERRQ